ncbi:glucose-6-phosphate isomerase [Candidatus Woesearchaeota archaeon]|nr:glucose-6-phosphate isomerase [Candidatus Woesearchaeota archaeon]
MIHLTKTAGFPLQYNETTHSFTSIAVIPKADVRTLKDIRSVLLDPTVKTTNPLYFMYRNVHLPEHTSLFKQHTLRYDITVVPPGFLGKEFIKTKGHHHKGVEIYEVLFGEALYLFENEKEVLAIFASTGSRVIVPYEYWHVTINVGKKTLIMANLMPAKVDSNYKDVEKKHGMMYYYVKGNRFVANEKFIKLLPLKKGKAQKARFPLYKEFLDYPDLFHLTH